MLGFSVQICRVESEPKLAVPVPKQANSFQKRNGRFVWISTYMSWGGQLTNFHMDGSEYEYSSEPTRPWNPLKLWQSWSSGSLRGCNSVFCEQTPGSCRNLRVQDGATNKHKQLTMKRCMVWSPRMMTRRWSACWGRGGNGCRLGVICPRAEGDRSMFHE